MPAAAAPRKTLIFHIGDHKTGSTSIQLAFAQRQVSIAGGEIFYPAQIANNVLGHHCRTYASETEKPKARKEAAAAMRQVAERIRASEARYNLVSAESIERVPAPVFRAIVDEFFAGCADEIGVVAYVRPHPGRITSTFAERTKIGAQRILDGDLESLCEQLKETREFFYGPRFSAWREAFGENFLLRPMIRSELYRGSVVDDFVRHAFGTEDFTIMDAGQANESLDLVDLMRLKVLQKRVIGQTTRALRLHMGWEFARLVGQMPPPEKKTKLALHRTLAESIRDTYLEDARTIDREFFGGRPLLETDLTKAVSSAVAEPQSTDPKDYLSAADMRSLDIFSALVAEMLEAKDVEWPSFFHKKRVRDMRQAKAAVADAAE